jgi:uncharacterized coiled-coil protein SlyX
MPLYRILFPALLLTGCIPTGTNNNVSKSDLNGLEERIQALEDLSAEGRLSALESEMTSQAADITTNADAITTNADAISTNADAINWLNADLADVADQVNANVPVRTHIEYWGPSNGNTSLDFIQLRELGSFNKLQASTDIRLTWASHVTQSGSGFCNFQPRIDGDFGENSYGAIINTEDTHIPVSVTQSYSGLDAGTHTVSLWVRGQGNGCEDNPGNYPREVFIEEGPSN